MSEVKFKLAAGTNVGLIRQNNEDNFVVCPDLSTSTWLIPQDGDFAVLGNLGALLVVADGMGGANAGEVASAIAVQTIQDLFVADEIKRVVGDDKSIQKFMVDVVKAADLNILNRSKADKSSRGMGTTIVMAWILGRRAYVCWCGDSRCYVMSQRKGLVQISKDHSYVQDLVDRGELEPEYMHDHPLSNVITRCLGDLEKRAQPDTRVCELYNGDSILLCSDGLSGMCFDNQIAAIMTECNENAMECKNELISAALSGGGHDNVTVALCTVMMEEEGELGSDSTGSSYEPSKMSEAEELRSTVPTGGRGRRKPIQQPDVQKEPAQEEHVEEEAVKEVPAPEQPVQEQQANVEENVPEVKEEKSPADNKDEGKAQRIEDTVKGDTRKKNKKTKKLKEKPANVEAKPEEKAEAAAEDADAANSEKAEEEKAEAPQTEGNDDEYPTQTKKSKTGMWLLIIAIAVAAIAAWYYLKSDNSFPQTIQSGLGEDSTTVEYINDSTAITNKVDDSTAKDSMTVYSEVADSEVTDSTESF